MSSLVAVAATAGYLWRGALDDPTRISRILPPEAFSDTSQPPVIYVPAAETPGSTAKPAAGSAADRPSPAGTPRPSARIAAVTREAHDSSAHDAELAQLEAFEAGGQADAGSQADGEAVS